MPIGLDVVVDADLGFEPLGVLVAPLGECLHRRPVDRLERLGARAGQLLERPVVQLAEERCDRSVELGEEEELPVAKTRQDPAARGSLRPLYHGACTAAPR